MTFRLGVGVSAIKRVKETVEVSLEGETLRTDVLLMSLGRKPFTEGLGLEAQGIQLDERGCVVVDGRYQTTCPGVYAIGDVIAGPMLAHKAEEEGVAVAEILAGQAGHVNYGVIPSVVYTSPQVACVGETEAQLQSKNIPYRTGQFPFMASGRAKVTGEDVDGFVKILAHSETDRVLGVHILGPDAETLIGEAALAMEFGASAEDIARTCHAHPSYSETLKEAALAVHGRALHS
jgi:dihydrolipoamide dehydrogenase